MKLFVKHKTILLKIFTFIGSIVSVAIARIDLSLLPYESFPFFGIPASVFIAFFFLGLFLKTFDKLFSLRQMSVALALSFFAIFLGIFFANFQGNVCRSNIGATGRAISNVGQLVLGLERYHHDNGRYPPLAHSCPSSSELNSALIPRYVPQVFPSGISAKDWKRKLFEFSCREWPLPIHVGINKEGTEFVVQSELTYASSVLDDDRDGTVLGCTCDDPNYCIGSGFLEK